MTPENSLPTRIFDTQGAADYLTGAHAFPHTPQTLKNKRSAGTGPLYRLRGRNVVYMQADLDTYAIEALSPPVRNTAEARTMRRAAGARG